MHKTALTMAVLLFAFTGWVAADQHSPYTGMEQRAIKALPNQDVAGLLDGKGMGFAKTAELNHYPGPSHVLELADQLQLNDNQKTRTMALFKSMQDKARSLGAAYIARERELDAMFAQATIDSKHLKSILDDIAGVQAELRRIHLQAHLEQRAILTREQIARYDQLRGYGAGMEASDHQHMRHHPGDEK